jgi:hypothetical protein
MFGHGVICLKTRSPTLEVEVTVSVDVMIVVIVVVEVRVFVGPALLVAAFPVMVTVLVASPTATNRLAEISTPAMTMVAAMTR